MAEEAKQKATLLNMETCTAYYPQIDDPRFFLMNQISHCWLRYQQFCRCARELGEDNVRCKYQYYRAQNVCTESYLEEAMEHRAKGIGGPHDRLPDRSDVFGRQ